MPANYVTSSTKNERFTMISAKHHSSPETAAEKEATSGPHDDMTLGQSHSTRGLVLIVQI